MSRLEDLLPVPTDADRNRRRDDLISRARTVRAHGWDDYLYTWSKGEVCGAALVLDDQAVLDEFGETRESTLSRYAYDLFGLRGGAADEAAGFTQTQTWFTDARAALLAG